MPSATGANDDPIGLVSVKTAATRISVSVTPGAVTGRCSLKAFGLTLLGVVPPLGIVEVVLPDDPEFPHAAATSAITTPTARTRARMLPPGTPKYLED